MKFKYNYFFALLISFSKLFSQSSCDGSQNCGSGGSIFSITNSNISNIAADSAILNFNEIMTQDGTNTFGQGTDNMGALFFVAWSTNCNAVCSTNGQNLAGLDTSSYMPSDLSSYKYQNETRAGGFVGELSNFNWSLGTVNIKLSKLVPGTKYYARAIILSQDYVTNQNYYAYGPVVTFTSASISVKINPATNTANVKAIIPNTFQAKEIYSSGICWSTTPNPSFNWLKPVTGTYTNTSISPNTNTYLMTGLLSNTTYYVCAYAYAGKSKNSKSYYGPVVSFTTGTIPLGNNNISGNQLICLINGTYNPTQISGTLPTGGNGIYTYTWQTSNDGGNTWFTGTPFANSSQQNLSTNGANLNSNSSGILLFKRLVGSAGQTNTSNTVSINLLPLSYTPGITINQIPYQTNDLLLQVSVLTPLDSFSLQWQKSISGGSFTNITSLSNGNLLLPVSTSSLNSYQVVLTYSNSSCPSFTCNAIGISPPDGDGNIYPTVKIGNQIWMMNNLRATTFNDRTPINKYTMAITSTVTPAPTYTANYYWFNNDSVTNAVTYGALYNPLVIQTNGSKNVCPIGWKPAGATDWDALVKISGGVDNAGNALKNNSGWYNNSTGATNLYNFNALPSGYFINDFYGKNLSASWWGLSSDLTGTPHYYQISTSSGAIYPMNFSSISDVLNMYHAVRCVH